MKTSTIAIVSLTTGILLGASTAWAAISSQTTTTPNSLKYIAMWTVVLNTALPPEQDPYTGEQSKTSVAKTKRILKILWHGFKTEKEAQDFKGKAPTEVQKTFHIDEVPGGYDE